MLLQTLRIHLASSTDADNWLGALRDPRLAKVLETMQTDFARDWSLEDLARIAGMSRSGFAATFGKKVGLAPMAYLTSWRMQIAAELLEAGDASLVAVAAAVGYRSESAFSVAFCNVLQCRPGEYRRRAAHRG